MADKGVSVKWFLSKSMFGRIAFDDWEDSLDDFKGDFSFDEIILGELSGEVKGVLLREPLDDNTVGVGAEGKVGDFLVQLTGDSIG